MRIATALRSGLLLSIVVAAIVAVSSLPAARQHRARADADYAEFAPYLQRGDGRAADPVNLIFLGEDQAPNIGLDLISVLHWSTVDGSLMSFMQKGRLLQTEVQLGDSLGGENRRHLRVAAVGPASPTWGPFALAGVHRDESVACGHVGRGYDEERNRVARAMEEDGYSVTWLWLGNSGPVRHCDGSLIHGDGYAAVIDLRRPDYEGLASEPANLNPIAAAKPAAVLGSRRIAPPRGAR